MAWGPRGWLEVTVPSGTQRGDGPRNARAARTGRAGSKGEGRRKRAETGQFSAVLGWFGAISFPFCPKKSRWRLPPRGRCKAPTATKPMRSWAPGLRLGAKFSSAAAVSARARLRLLPWGGQHLPGHPNAPPRTAPASPRSCDGGSGRSLRPGDHPHPRHGVPAAWRGSTQGFARTRNHTCGYFGVYGGAPIEFYRVGRWVSAQ